MKTTGQQRPELIIFDCDGVLIDSEGLSCQILSEALMQHGVEIDFDYFCANYLGRSFPTVAKDIRKTFNVVLPADFELGYRNDLLAAFETALKPTPGIFDLLDRLGPPVCVATSSSPERVARSLGITGLDRYFEGRVFTASMVPRGKPAPDIFLLVAKTYGVRPDRALVVEDSLSGIAAARAAGMDVLRYTGGSHLTGRLLKHDEDLETFDKWPKIFDMRPGLERSGRIRDEQ